MSTPTDSASQGGGGSRPTPLALALVAGATALVLPTLTGTPPLLVRSSANPGIPTVPTVTAPPSAPGLGGGAAGVKAPADPAGVVKGPTEDLRVSTTALTTRGTVGGLTAPIIELNLDVWRAEAQGAAAVEEVQVDSLPLRDSLRGQQLPSSTSSPSKVGSPLKITINTSKAEAGRYTGFALIKPKGSSSPVLSVPVTVELKHAWGWPTLILVVTYLLYQFVQSFRINSLPIYQVWDKLRLIDEAANDDYDLGNDTGEPSASFRRAVKKYIEAATVILQGRPYPTRSSDADEKLSKASATLNSWQRDREYWKKAKATLDEWGKELETSPSRGNHANSLLKKIEVLWTDTAPAATDYNAFKIKADEFQAKKDNYLNVLAELDRITRADFRNEAQKLATDWRKVDSDNSQELDRISKAKDDLLARIAAAPVPAAEGDIPESFSAFTLVGGIPDAPNRNTFLSSGTYDQAQRAHNALTRYSKLVWWVAYLAFILLGLQQAYLSNPTFGADLWADYTPLVIWGLGANAASQAVISGLTTAGWSLPARDPA